MKTIVLSILFLLVSLKCYPEQYYVYIDKIGYVQEGEEAGHSGYGDVVDICPYTSQYKPTKAELAHYKVMVMDLTLQEEIELTEPEVELDYVDPEMGNVYKTVRARKRKIDIDKLSAIKQEEIVSDKTIVFKELILKPNLIIDIQ